jgi:hypothetical protein
MPENIRWEKWQHRKNPIFKRVTEELLKHRSDYFVLEETLPSDCISESWLIDYNPLTESVEIKPGPEASGSFNQFCICQS